MCKSTRFKIQITTSFARTPKKDAQKVSGRLLRPAREILMSFALNVHNGPPGSLPRSRLLVGLNPGEGASSFKAPPATEIATAKDACMPKTCGNSTREPPSRPSPPKPLYLKANGFQLKLQSLCRVLSVIRFRTLTCLTCCPPPDSPGYIPEVPK